MNEYERQRKIAESTRKLYPPGTRIELISMKDPYAPVPAGTRGTVKFVDSMGTIFPEWDNNRTIGIVPGEDSFRKLSQEEIKAENQSSSEVEDIVSVFKIIQELLAPTNKKGKNQFQLLMDYLPDDHKAKWFAGAALNTAEQSMSSVMSTALSRLNAL